MADVLGEIQVLRARIDALTKTLASQGRGAPRFPPGFREVKVEELDIPPAAAGFIREYGARVL